MIEYTYSEVHSPEREDDPQAALRKFKAEIFQLLAHPTRLHMVECLGRAEMTVSQILEEVKVEPANASQHLAVLRARGVVSSRKQGNKVFYTLRNPLLAQVLQLMRQYFKAHVEDEMAALREMET